MRTEPSRLRFSSPSNQTSKLELTLKSDLYKHKMLATNPSRAINKAILEELTFDRPDSKLSNTS